jgi:predicted nucleic acid-binding protein
MTAICDTGPLVAYLNRHDPHHAWAVAVMKQVRPPMLTCEAVLTEAVPGSLIVIPFMAIPRG